MGWDSLTETQRTFLQRYVVAGGGTAADQGDDPLAARRSSRRSILQALEARVDSMVAEFEG